MLSLDESRIAAKVQASLGVQHIRVQIHQAEAELQQANDALSELPVSVRSALLQKHEDALEALLQREKTLIAQARRTAEGELAEERVESLRIEAEPLLQRVAKCLEAIRSDLEKVTHIEAEARANRGRVMAESFDRAAIDYYIPRLLRDNTTGMWSFKR